MKSVVALLLLVSFSVVAQVENRLVATVDVGGCINSDLIWAQASLGDEWELRLIPVNKLDREVEGRIETDLINDEVASVGRKHNHAIFKGPILEARIDLKSDEKLRVEIWDKSRGLHNFFRNERYVIAELDSRLVKKSKPFLKGKDLTNKAADCLTVNKD